MHTQLYFPIPEVIDPIVHRLCKQYQMFEHFPSSRADAAYNLSHLLHELKGKDYDNPHVSRTIDYHIQNIEWMYRHYLDTRGSNPYSGREVDRLLWGK